jgi:CheY-like chemotaxis protein
MNFEFYFEGRPLKVLIVDDNEQARRMVRDYLRGTADDFRECDDGVGAASAYAEFRPDWVLMDQDMPKMDGITAIREIIAEFPMAKICMVTAFDDDEIRSEALSAGARRFVAKDNLCELEAILAG